MAILNRTSKRTGTIAYQVMIDRRDPVTGKRNRVTVGTFRTKKEAQRAERKALDAAENNRYIERTAMTVADLMQEWLGHKQENVSDQTAAGYHELARLHIIPAIGHAQIQYLKPLDIQRWANGITAGDRTRERALGTLRQAFAFAVQMKVIPSSPCDGVSVKKPEPKQHVMWTDAQLRAFLAVAEDDTYGPLWHLLAVTGMRFSEAAGLRWSDIDTVGKTIRIRQVVIPDKAASSRPVIKPSPKSEAGRRVITVSERTIAYLNDHRHEHELVNCYANGKPLQHSGMRRKLLTLCKVAGVPPISPHALRHLHATNLARAGVPLRVSMERMGHASPEVLLGIYQHVDQEMRADVVAKLDALLG